MWRNPGEVAGDGIDNDGNGFIDDVFGINAITNSGDPMDDQGHGTHCAGTIGAVGNNGIGMTGVAWNVQLMALKFLSADGSGATSDAIQCIDYAISKGAHILSNSWGGPGGGQALEEAIARSRDANTIFVAAAGNESANNDVTASFPANSTVSNVVSVAATDRNDRLASFSNYGATSVDIAAPGVDIFSTYVNSDSAYQSLSGTSMATPHVSGIFALMWAQFPNATPADLIARLYATADPIPGLSGRVATGARANLQRALTQPSLAPVNDAFDQAVNLSGETSSTTASTTLATKETGEPNHVGNSGGASLWYRWTAPKAGTVTIKTTGSNFNTLLAVYTGTAVGALTEVASNANGTNSMVSFAVTQGTSYAIAVDGFNDARGSLSLSLAMPLGNDLFADAQTIVGEDILLFGTNSGAAAESGEPSRDGATAAASVWYRWTAPVSARVTATAYGNSGFDSVIGVHTGSSVSGLTTVGANDDYTDWLGTSRIWVSRTEFDAVAGTTYFIAVDGFAGANGDFALILTNGRNDSFANAKTLSSSATIGIGANRLATAEFGEPSHAGTGPNSTLWWQWTAPANTSVSIDTLGSDYDTVLGVYTGSSVNGLTTIASNDDDPAGEYNSRVVFDAVAGTTYLIAVDGFLYTTTIPFTQSYGVAFLTVTTTNTSPPSGRTVVVNVTDGAGTPSPVSVNGPGNASFPITTNSPAIFTLLSNLADNIFNFMQLPAPLPDAIQ
jgi:hypothetical protein